MADTFINIAPDPPEPFIVSKISSAAGSVADKVKREFLPTAQTDYKFDTNDEIEFHVSSTDSFWVVNETYIRFNLRVQATQNVALIDDFLVELEEGGAHNLFRRLEIRDNAGTDICTNQSFDLLSHIRCSVIESPDYVNHAEWHRGDSAKTYGEDDIWVNIAGTHDYAELSPDQITGTGTTYLAELAEGDEIQIINSLRNCVIATTYVTEVVSDTVIRIMPLGRGDISGVIMNVRRSVRNQICRQNNNTLTTKGVDIVLHLCHGFFEMREDFPLFLMSGIRVKLFLKEPRFAFNSGHCARLDTGKVLDYQISTPRLIAYLRTPDASIAATYLQAHASGALAYSFPMYHHLQRQESGEEASELQLDLPVAKSSVNRVMFVVQNVRTRGSTNSASPLTDVYSYPNKTFIDGKIKNYQFRVGGKDYPQQRVEANDVFQTEVFNEYLRTFQIDKNTLAVPRAPGVKWTRTNQNSNVLGEYDEAHKVVYSTSFSTLDRDRFSGLRTRGPGTDNHIILTMELSGQHLVDGSPSTRYIDIFMEFTRILHINPAGVSALD